MRKFTKDEELEFNISGTSIRGKFLSINENRDIEFEVVSDSSGQKIAGDVITINEYFFCEEIRLRTNVDRKVLDIKESIEDVKSVIKKPKTERIICSAIWYKDFPKPAHTVTNCDHGIVLCGHRHGHIIHQHVTAMGKVQSEMGEYTQGFLTNLNRFVDRKEAAKIHVKNGGKLNYSTKDLYSEDIY